MIFLRSTGCFLVLALAGGLTGCMPKDPTTLTPGVAVLRIEARTPGSAASTLGRGFFVSSDGLVVTSLHVIDGAQDITVTRDNGDKLFAEFVQGDKDADLAIIRVHTKNPPVLKLCTEDVPPGTHVRLVGTAGITLGVFDHWEDLGNQLSVTTQMLPTDGGSPLLADDGRVVAVAGGPLKDNPSEFVATPIFRLFKLMPALSQQGIFP